jgi:hypothetical protein|tara:strand:+ start:64 stop:354 length:291 start_codon:yes stop_codon:yes gene_type:complete
LQRQKSQPATSADGSADATSSWSALAWSALAWSAWSAVVVGGRGLHCHPSALVVDGRGWSCHHCSWSALALLVVVVGARGRGCQQRSWSVLVVGAL